MKRMTAPQAAQYSPLALAFLGDSVYEVMVRDALLREGNCPVQKLHDAKVRLVCAAFQANAADLLYDRLSEEEKAVYRRGRNASGNPPKHADPADYRKATGFEAVFGFLHLTGRADRLDELFRIVWAAGQEHSEE